MNIIRKGRVRWLPKGEVLGQKKFIERPFGIASGATYKVVSIAE